VCSHYVDIISCGTRLPTVNGEIFVSQKRCKGDTIMFSEVRCSVEGVTKRDTLPPARSFACLSIPVYLASCNIVLGSEC
jgi:hypothetical protein